MGIHHELNIKDHLECFRNDEFKQMIKNKREKYEDWVGEDKVKEIAEWTKSWEYRELNFKREAISINPAKACQPLGALLCALGFEKTLPFSHGSQGCVAYFRTHMARHFKEPVPMVSTSMTEDAAVFGGQNNMHEGLQNAIALYRPKMIAVNTTCMAEVIGDDLNSFIANAKEKGLIPEDFPIPFAHTPSFVGSHITGYDNQMVAILRYMTEYFEKYGVDNVDKYDPEEGEFYKEGGLLSWLEVNIKGGQTT